MSDANGDSKVGIGSERTSSDAAAQRDVVDLDAVEGGASGGHTRLQGNPNGDSSGATNADDKDKEKDNEPQEQSPGDDEAALTRRIQLEQEKLKSFVGAEGSGTATLVPTSGAHQAVSATSQAGTLSSSHPAEGIQHTAVDGGDPESSSRVPPSGNVAMARYATFVFTFLVHQTF